MAPCMTGCTYFKGYKLCMIILSENLKVLLGKSLQTRLESFVVCQSKFASTNHNCTTTGNRLHIDPDESWWIHSQDLACNLANIPVFRADIVFFGRLVQKWKLPKWLLKSLWQEKLKETHTNQENGNFTSCVVRTNLKTMPMTHSWNRVQWRSGQVKCPSPEPEQTTSPAKLQLQTKDFTLPFFSFNQVTN